MAGRFKYLRDNDLSLKSIWAWAKQLVQDLNSHDIDVSKYASPVGVQMFWAGAEAPLGWLLCDGATYSKAKYPELFLALGYTFGGADDSFNVPDMRDRLLMGAGSIVGLGQTAGRDKVALSGSELPEHTHDINDPGHTHAFTAEPHNHALTDPGHSHTYDGYGNGLAANAGSGGTRTATTKTTTTEMTNISLADALVTGNNAMAMTEITVEPTGTGQEFSILNPVIGVHVIIKAA